MTLLAVEIEDSLQAACREFTEATGWPLRFIPLATVEDAGLQTALQSDPDCCWFAEINDGIQRLGYLHISLPECGAADRSYLMICDLADLLARQLNRLAVTTRALTSRTQDVSTLLDIGRSAPRDEDLLRALQQLLRAAVQLTGFRTAGFFLLNPAANCLRLRCCYHLDYRQVPHPVRDLTTHPPDLNALANGGFIVRRQSGDAAGWLPSDSSIGQCVPVESQVGPLGTLWTYDRRMRTPSPQEVQMIESIAMQIANVLERAVLMQESRTQHRLKGELRLASQGQPRGLVCPLPAGSGIEAAARCTSRHEVGGDLFELIPISQGRTVLAVGDASGDSIPAAVVMSAVRGALRAIAGYGDELQPEQVMDRINKSLCGMTSPHQFMSLLYGVVDPRKMTLHYTNAGHPAPLLFRDGRSLDTRSHGMLVGVVEDATYQSSILGLRPGDILVCFSDGISEAMTHDRRMFRADGIIAAVQKRLPGSAEDVLMAIWSAMESHRDGGRDADDRTLLVIKMDET
jgi:phosphoserine phosphatase RsbU/P